MIRAFGADDVEAPPRPWFRKLRFRMIDDIRAQGARIPRIFCAVCGARCDVRLNSRQQVIRIGFIGRVPRGLRKASATYCHSDGCEQKEGRLVLTPGLPTMRTEISKRCALAGSIFESFQNSAQSLLLNTKQSRPLRMRSQPDSVGLRKLLVKFQCAPYS